MGTGLTIVTTVTSSYTTPSTTANAALSTNATTPISIGSGIAVLFSTVGPYGSSPTSTLAASGYTQYLPHQLQTTNGAAAGDTATATWTLQYNES